MQRNVIGLMSGTSCDGVDAALVSIRTTGRRSVGPPCPTIRWTRRSSATRATSTAKSVQFLSHLHVKYPQNLRQLLLHVMNNQPADAAMICRLNVRLGEIFARAACRLMEREGIHPDLIGSHGQTICHLPGTRGVIRSTLQIGEPSIIAARTGVTTVADFRQADIAAGGMGAPLVPWTDYVLFAGQTPRAVQNIGGIANVTYLPAGASPDDVIAFDTGPGNMVIDEIVRRVTKGQRTYDRNGAMAAKGNVNPAVLEDALAHPYFRKRPPKSTGRKTFGQNFVQDWISAHRRRRISDCDWIATATMLTAQSIADAYRKHLSRIDDVILCGGGSKNKTLVAMLAEQLPSPKITPIDDLGIPTQAKEALSFAMLAVACIDRVPANLPQITGANRPAILGKITPAPP